MVSKTESIIDRFVASPPGDQPDETVRQFQQLANILGNISDKVNTAGEVPPEIIQAIEANTAAINALTPRVTANEGAIQTNQGDISTNRVNITTNAGGIATNAAGLARINYNENVADQANRANFIRLGSVVVNFGKNTTANQEIDGSYTISFRAPFAGRNFGAAVVPSNAANRYASITATNGRSMNVRIWRADATGISSSHFHWIAIGEQL